MRIGHGYDVHRLTPGRPLILGGVDIPYDKGLLGHSDADVLVHAIIDALLGAAGMGDIGKMFPDSEIEYKDISSLILLDRACEKVKSRGYLIANLDCTIIAQSPRLSEYISEMLWQLAVTMKISETRINIKATTEEGLGFTGSGEGIAAHAVILLEQ